MIKAPLEFSTDPGKILDFSGRRPAEIFNDAILPKVNAVVSIIDEGRQQREAQLAADLNLEQQLQQKDEEFLSEFMYGPPKPSKQDYERYGINPDDTDYNSPMSTDSNSQAAPSETSNQTGATNLTDFVKNFEGFSPKAFGDYKQMSIGYGTRARKGETTISREEAERRLSDELGKARRHVEAVNKKYGYNFQPNELDALTSFAYNIGNINQLTDDGKRDRQQIATKMLEYNRAGGKVLKGLVKRRQAEQELFTKGY